jgi:ferredoxin-type protein NapG
MKRRSFMQNMIFAGGVLVASNLPYGLSRLLAPNVQAATRSRREIPLPGALADPEAFAQACIGCGLCSEVCPPDCIRFHAHEGGNRVNLPYINPEQKACTLCGKCMEVCPTDALTVTDRTKVDMGIAQIDRTACYPWVDHGICGACVSACPLGHDAINFNMWNQYRPVVQKDCVGCGLCVESCPHPSLPIRIVERSKGTITPQRI